MNTQPYIRPTLTKEEEANVAAIARAFMFAKGSTYVLSKIIAMLKENIMLTKEVNLHRATLGIEPLPTFDNKLT